MWSKFINSKLITSSKHADFKLIVSSEYIDCKFIITYICTDSKPVLSSRLQTDNLKKVYQQQTDYLE